MEDEQLAPSGAITVSRDGAYRQVDGVATWSPWEAFGMAAEKAPILPGVYMMRTTDGTIVYVGMAGERPGGGKPSGMRGRLRIYVSGKGAVSGFGEGALDRALADPGFIRAQLAHVDDGEPRRAKRWAQDAIAWHGVELRWTVTADLVSARDLEDEIVKSLRPHGLWNR